MKAIILSLTLLFFSLSNYYSCGNEYGYSLDGKRMFTRYFFLSSRNYQFNQLKIKARLTELALELNKNQKDYKILSDIAVNLMKIGEADSSVQILQKLVHAKPKEYNLSANLGTAYELVGKLDSALKYISKGYQLNKQSHRGSEWVHIKILEAKIKQKKDANWIIMNPIISEKVLDQFKKTSKFNNNTVRQINQNLFYQIKTRAPFTPAPNQTITNLLITLGDFNFKHGTYENSILAYIYALKFNKNVWLKNKIELKIEKLNRKKQGRVINKETPILFKRMLTRSNIDPNILVLGLDKIEAELEGLTVLENKYIDSLIILKNQKDSMQKYNERVNNSFKEKYKTLAMKNVNEKIQKDNTISYLIYSLATSIILLFVFYLKYRNKNKLN